MGIIVDGDGCFMWYDGGPLLDLLGSRHLVTQYASFLAAELPIKAPLVRPYGSIFKCRVTHYRAGLAARLLYDGAKIFLPRKRDLALAARLYAEEREMWHHHPCLMDGCMRRHKVQGLCDLHYRRWRKGKLEFS